MRHGTTEWNIQQKMQGQADIPLNEKGKEDAIKASFKLKDIHFNKCYCSPLIRAKETANLVLSDKTCEIIPEDLLKEIENGYDIVIGSRFVTEKKPFSMRMLGNRMIERAIKFSTGKVLTDPTSGMRMYSKKIIHEFASNINYGPEPDTISFMIKQGASVKDVQVKMDERTAGESYLNLTRSIAYMLRMMLSILFIQNFRKRRKAD